MQTLRKKYEFNKLVKLNKKELVGLIKDLDNDVILSRNLFVNLNTFLNEHVSIEELSKIDTRLLNYNDCFKSRFHLKSNDRRIYKFDKYLFIDEINKIKDSFIRELLFNKLDYYIIKHNGLVSINEIENYSKNIQISKKLYLNKDLDINTYEILERLEKMLLSLLIYKTAENVDKINVGNNVFTVDFDNLKGYLNKIQSKLVKDILIENLNEYSNDKNELNLKSIISLTNELIEAKSLIYSEDEDNISVKNINKTIDILEDLTLKGFI